MPELHQEVTAFGFDGLSAARPAVSRIGRELEFAHPHVGCWMVDDHALGEDQARAAADTLAVVLDGPVADLTLNPPATLHGRHDEPVGKGDAIDGQRREQR